MNTLAKTFTYTEITLRDLRYRIHKRLARYQRAWHYAFGTLTENDAYEVLYECQQVAGDFALESLSVEHLLDQARDKWQDHPQLKALCFSAASRVASKWSPMDDYVYEAEQWALNLVREYAEHEDIKLIDLE